MGRGHGPGWFGNPLAHAVQLFPMLYRGLDVPARAPHLSLPGLSHLPPPMVTGGAQPGAPTEGLPGCRKEGRRRTGSTAGHCGSWGRKQAGVTRVGVTRVCPRPSRGLVAVGHLGRGKGPSLAVAQPENCSLDCEVAGPPPPTNGLAPWAAMHAQRGTGICRGTFTAGGSHCPRLCWAGD